MNEKICDENGRLFHFNDDGKPEIFYMQTNIACAKKYFSSFSLNTLN